MENKLVLLLFLISVFLLSGCVAPITTLNDAVFIGDLNKAKSIIIENRDKINQIGTDGLSPLHIAARHGDFEMANYLIIEGADINLKNDYLETPLHMAIYNGNISFIKFLVEKGTDVNAKDKDNDTPLHAAAGIGSVEITRYLISKGSEINARGRFNYTPLLKAMNLNNAKLAAYLIDQGADIYAKDEAGRTALYYALMRGNLQVIRALVSHGVNIKIKGNYKFDIASTSIKNGSTPLHLASYRGHVDVVDYLLSEKADANSKDDEGNYPIHYALDKTWNTRKNYVDLTKKLIAHSADVNSINTKGNTPLHIAAKQGQIEVAKFLISNGADITLKNNDGKTAMVVAHENQNIEIAEYLTSQLELAKEKKISKEEKLAVELETTQVKKTPDSDSVESKKEIFSDTIGFGTYHALVIGNNAYKQLPDLETAEHDAQRVGDVLQHLYGFKVKVLLNGTRRKIIKALDKYRKELTIKDNLLIYYAGHGYFDKSANRGYWLPVEAEKETTADWISNADITDKLKAYRAKHVIVVADSCYSGALTRGLNIQVRETGYLKRIAKKRARTVLTSGGNEPVYDGGGEGHSVFARSFINALEENTGVMDATELYLKIRRPVILNAPQTPQYSDIRFAGHDGGDFIFIRRK